jgi:hypothetical protein
MWFALQCLAFPRCDVYPDVKAAEAGDLLRSASTVYSVELNVFSRVTR